MKKIWKLTIYIIFSSLYVISTSCVGKRVDVLSSIPDGFNPMYMFGNVQEVVVMSEYLNDTIRLDEEGKVLQKGHRHYVYDVEGTLIRQHAGSHIINEYVYDEGLIIASKHYRRDELRDIHKYSYDNKSRLISKKWYKSDVLNVELQYEYDEEGNVIKETELDYSFANEMYSRFGLKRAPSETYVLYFYDSDGNVEREEWYNGSELESSKKFRYDKRGNVEFKEELDYEDMEKEVVTYRYKYDPKGNWIECIESCNGDIRTIKREITYF